MVLNRSCIGPAVHGLPYTGPAVHGIPCIGPAVHGIYSTCSPLYNYLGPAVHVNVSARSFDPFPGGTFGPSVQHQPR